MQRARRVSISSESTDSDDDFSKTSTRRSTAAKRGAKADALPAKRKAANAKSPPPKRAKLAEDAPLSQNDPVRKYCLGKLKEVIQAIFVEFATIGIQSKDDNAEAPSNLNKSMPDEDKQVAVDKATEYVSDLEANLFEKYSEPDKNGKASAGGKYK